MGWLDSVVEIGTLGLVDDVTGSEAAAAAATAGATRSAAAMTAANEENRGYQEDIYRQQMGLWNPYQTAGLDAMGQYQAGIGGQPSYTGTEAYSGGLSYDPFSFDPSQVTLDPGIQRRQQQGEQAVNRALGQGGFNVSGNRLAEVMKYNQGLASDEYSRAYGRQYGAATDAYARGRQGAMDQYNVGYQQNQDIYGRGIDAYNIQNQQYNDRMQRYGALMGMGMQGTSNISGALGTMGQNVGAGILGAGGIQADLASNLANIQAAEATSNWNTLMDVGGLAATAYGAGAFGGGGGGGDWSQSYSSDWWNSP